MSSKYGASNVARLGLALAVACFVLSASRPSGAASESFASAGAKVQARNKRLLQRWTSRGQLSHVRNPSGGISATVLDVGAGDHRFVLRRPGSNHSVEHVVRVNTALQRLAAELGEERMIAGAVGIRLDANVGSLPAGAEVMLMSHFGGRYVNGDAAGRSALAAIPERQRLAGALMDVLSEQIDRKDQNVMVHDGKARLPDADNSFGKGRAKQWIIRSTFSPGRTLAYSSSQGSFKDLVRELPEAEAVIEHITQSSASTLRAHYGLKETEVQVLKKEAQRVKDGGLDKAFEQLFAEFSTIYDNV